MHGACERNFLSDYSDTAFIQRAQKIGAPRNKATLVKDMQVLCGNKSGARQKVIWNSSSQLKSVLIHCHISHLIVELEFNCFRHRRSIFLWVYTHARKRVHLSFSAKFISSILYSIHLLVLYLDACRLLEKEHRLVMVCN